MNQLLLGVPIQIGGEEVIICRDSIGSQALSSSRESEVYTIIEGPREDGRPAIYIDEDELKSMRESYPGINVYGLWQLLFANNLVPLGNEVIISQWVLTAGFICGWTLVRMSINLRAF
jgi:hypothetical protein